MKEIVVLNMMCAHCEGKIKQALARHNIAHEIDLPTKTVKVVEQEKAIAIIEQLGYKIKK